MAPDKECIELAGECMQIAALTEDQIVREKLIEMARNWVIAAMGEGTSHDTASTI